MEPKLPLVVPISVCFEGMERGHRLPEGNMFERLHRLVVEHFLGSKAVVTRICPVQPVRRDVVEQIAAREADL